jgi:hypothetical protein
MNDHSEAYVAFDTSKLRNAVALAEVGRSGEVRFLGEFDNTPAATAKLVKTSRAFPRFESYRGSGTHRNSGQKAAERDEWFHGLGRLVQQRPPFIRQRRH